MKRPSSRRPWSLTKGDAVAITVLVLAGLISSPLDAQVAVKGGWVYTMAGAPIKDGVVVVREGKIAAIGLVSDIKIPEGFRLLEAAYVTPGLVDAHSTVGLSGVYNQDQDRDQLERSKPVQPELRAIDSYNARDRLVEWVRTFGVTTVHTGHAPGELVSGQTMIVKTWGGTADEASLVDAKAVVATLATAARKDGKGSPGTRGKMVAMLRAELIKAQEYLVKRSQEDVEKRPPRDLGLETLGRVLKKEMPLLVTAHRAQDIAGALRLAREFSLDLILDGAAEAYLLIDQIKAARVPVILHPTMARARGDLENASLETASKLRQAGIPVALQSGYETYVPKTRVVLFEAALAAANGLSFEEALATITIDAARILGIDARVGSLVVGKDGDLALYDGDPFEYTSHCIGVVIDGRVVSEEKR